MFNKCYFVTNKVFLLLHVRCGRAIECRQVCTKGCRFQSAAFSDSSILLVESSTWQTCYPEHKNDYCPHTTSWTVYAYTYKPWNFMLSIFICPLSTALLGPHIVFCEYLLYRVLQRVGIATISTEISVLFYIVLIILRLF